VQLNHTAAEACEAMLERSGHAVVVRDPGALDLLSLCKPGVRNIEWENASPKSAGALERIQGVVVNGDVVAVVAVVAEGNGSIVPEALLDFKAPLFVPRRLVGCVRRRKVGRDRSRSRAGVKHVEESCVPSSGVSKEVAAVYLGGRQVGRYTAASANKLERIVPRRVVRQLVRDEAREDIGEDPEAAREETLVLEESAA